MKLPLHQCAACGGFFKRILFVAAFGVRPTLESISV